MIEIRDAITRELILVADESGRLRPVAPALRLAFEHAEGRCSICGAMITPAGLVAVLDAGSIRPAHRACTA
jgi:hypothetical protein